MLEGFVLCILLWRRKSHSYRSHAVISSSLAKKSSKLCEKVSLLDLPEGWSRGISKTFQPVEKVGITSTTKRYVECRYGHFDVILEGFSTGCFVCRDKQ